MRPLYVRLGQETRVLDDDARMIVEPRVHLRLKSIELWFPIARLRGEELQLHECVLCTSEILQVSQMPGTNA